MDEIKEAISNNKTPAKTIQLEQTQRSSDENLIQYNENEWLQNISNELDPWKKANETRKSSFNNLISLDSNITHMNLKFPNFSEVFYSDSEVILKQ